MRSIVALCLGVLLLASCEDKQNNSTLLSSEEMKELMLLDSVQLIDVRSLEAFREGHLKGAQNLVYDDDFIDKIKKLDKSKPVAVYCRTGRRSEKCSKILKKAGFEQIYQLKDGLSQWKYKDELIIDTLAQ